MKILIINDEEEIRKILSKYLTAKGYTVKSAPTGERAVDWIKEERFDVVFLDIYMPEISGIDVLDRIKKISAETRVIMMSGFLDEDLIRKVVKKGAYGLIRKPFKLEEIDEVLGE